MTAATFGTANAADPENTLVVQLSTGGPVTIELANDVAPNHAARLKELARAGFYDGLKFHRVIPGFMAQTGDPTGTGTSGSDKPDLAAEFSQKDYKRGTVGMARKSDPNSANSQFFICFDDTGCASLKGQYTVVGQVTSGMEFVDKVAVGEPPATPDTMVKVQVQADAEKPAAAAADASAPAPATTEAAPTTTTEAAPATAPADAAPAETAPAPAEAAPAVEPPAAAPAQ